MSAIFRAAIDNGVAIVRPGAEAISDALSEPMCIAPTINVKRTN
jgi:hypothetical protein